MTSLKNKLIKHINLNNKTKFRMMLTGTLLITMILITGTFAFVAHNQGAFNATWDNLSDRFSARLHDNFEDRAASGRGTVNGPGEYNKNIFVETFGYGDYFLRINFREFFELEGHAFGSVEADPANGVEAVDVDINDPSTWPIFRMEQNAGHIRREGVSADIGEFVEWTLGQPEDDGRMIFMPTHNHITRRIPLMTGTRLNVDTYIMPPLFQNSEANRFAHTTGRAVDQLAGFVRDSFFEIEDVEHASDIIEEGVQTGAWYFDETIGTDGEWVRRHDGTRNFWMLPADAITTRDACLAHYAENDEYQEGMVTLCTDLVADVTSRSQHTSNRLFYYDTRMRQTENVTHYAQPTLSPTTSVTPPMGSPIVIENGVMTLTQWTLASQTYCGMPAFNEGCRLRGNFWIMDTEDENGWFYWNGPLFGRDSRAEEYERQVAEDGTGDPLLLLPSTATSLLLSAFNIDEEVLRPGRAEWQYIIHVGVDFFTPATMDDLDLPISEAAMTILQFYIDNEDAANWIQSDGGAAYGPVPETDEDEEAEGAGAEPGTETGNEADAETGSETEAYDPESDPYDTSSDD